MEIIKIKVVTKESLNDLLELSKNTFIDSFSHLNNPDDFQTYLESAFTHEKLEVEITHPDSVFFFALFDQQPVGYLKVNFRQAQTEIKDEKALEVERIYVKKESQGKKIGYLLMQKAIQVAREHNLKYIWLGVWEKNTKAQCFYQSLGFEPFDNHIFWVGKDPQTDIMMRLILD